MDITVSLDVFYRAPRRLFTHYNCCFYDAFAWQRIKICWTLHSVCIALFVSFSHFIKYDAVSIVLDVTSTKWVKIDLETYPRIVWGSRKPPSWKPHSIGSRAWSWECNHHQYFKLSCVKVEEINFRICALFENRNLIRKTLANQIVQNLNSIDIGHNNVNKSTCTICIFYIMSLLWFYHPEITSHPMDTRMIIYPTESYLKKQTVSQHRNNQTSGSILPANCDLT